MLKNISSAFLSLVIISLIYSCETNNEYTKIDSPNEKIKIEGLSLLPPRGEGWHFKKKHPGSIIFGKLEKHRGQGYTLDTCNKKILQKQLT